MLLSLELDEVTDWFSLGLYLNIPSAELHSIKYEPTLQRIKDRRREMLSIWMTKLPEPSWSRVVKALMCIGRESLAHKLALKYGKTSILLEVQYKISCVVNGFICRWQVSKFLCPFLPETLQEFQFQPH